MRLRLVDDLMLPIAEHLREPRYLVNALAYGGSDQLERIPTWHDSRGLVFPKMIRQRGSG